MQVRNPLKRLHWARRSLRYAAAAARAHYTWHIRRIEDAADPQHDTMRKPRLRLAALAKCAKPFLLVIGSCVVAATTLSPRILQTVSQFPCVYSFTFFTLVLSIFLPLPLVWLSLPLSAAILAVLDRLNEIKISTLGLPITFFDIKLVAAAPTAAMNAVGLHAPQWLPYASTAAAVILVAALLIAPIRVANLRTISVGPTGYKLSVVTIAAVCVVSASYYGLTNYAKYLRTKLSTHDSTHWRDSWLPASQVSLSRRIGAPEYLVFSSLFERETAPHPTGSTDSSPTPSELERVASSFVDIRDKAANGLPNIVIMHAESTFDPNRAFRLAEPVDLPVWSAITETKALGPLKVNVVGGGSWVTDFEVITGVDSRLFGPQGYYTSYYVAPLINYSFVRYLSEKGYTAKAFSAIDGSFYNSEKAFGHYGFEQFVDGAELGMSSDWDKALDSDLAGAIIRYGAFAVGKVAEPFLYFIDSIENHGPHPCRNFESEEDFVTTFVHNGDFELNCELNEYLARAMSTSHAFSRILDELRSIEAATGRPYVLLVFGDHQPWDFTGGRYSVPGGDAVEQGFRDFATVRSNANVYETFFHLVSSEDGVIADLSGVTPPASFLPSLVSAFVASSYDELYFPENFFLLRVCGSDFATPDCDPYPGIAAGFITTLLAEAAER